MTAVSKVSGSHCLEALRAAKIVEGVVGNAWAADPEGRLTYVTPAALSFLGVTLDDLNAEAGGSQPFCWKRVVHPEDQAAAEAEWRRCLQTGDHYNIEYRLLHATGAFGWSRCSGQPLRNAEGRIIGWYGAVIDRDRASAIPEPAAMFAGENHDILQGAPAEELVHPHDRQAVAQARARAFWSGIPQIIRYRMRRPDGDYQPAEFRAEPGYDVSVDVDPLEITPDETWTTADFLGETVEAVRAAKVVEMLHGAAFAFDAAGKFTYATPIAQTSIAMTLEDLNRPLGDRTFVEGGDFGWKLGVHPDDYEGAAQHLRRCMRTGEPFNYEYRVLRAGGQYVWHRFAIRPTQDSQGRITGWYGIGFDIDAYKKTEEALRERARELSQLVDMIPSHVWRLTADGKPTFTNKHMQDYLGMDVADSDGPGASGLKSLINSVHPDDASEFERALHNSLATGQPFGLRYRLRRADGAFHWMSSRADPLRDSGGRIVQWYGLCHDIDNQVKAEEALRRSEEELRQLIDAVPALIWCMTPEGIPCYLNKRVTDVTGVSMEDMIAPDGSRSLFIVHPDDREATDEALTRAFETGVPFVGRYRQRRSNGLHRWVESRAEPLRDESGAIVRWYGVSVDIEDMMNAQEALRERERELWQLVETLPAMIDCAAPNGEPIYRSQQLRQFLGYELEDLDGSGKSRLAGTLDASVHPDDLAGVKERYANSLATGEPYLRKHRLKRYDGQYSWVETRAAAMRNEAGEIVQWNLICLDIDGEVRAQADLRLAQEKMARASQAASLAELSASIAHEVNQPLAAVVANSHACQRWLNSAPPNLDRAQRTVDRIIRDANAAADVVSRIRALFKRSSDARTPASLGDIANEAASLMTEEAQRRRVRLNVEIENGLPQVALDRIQVQQVLINLIRNGMEAMDNCSGDASIVVRVSRNEGALCTEVSDVGAGIDSPERVFEPFYTTKDNGMGMGLAICRSIIESHGGRLWAEKNQPCGSKFVFTVPVFEKAAP